MKLTEMPKMPSTWTGAARTFYETLCECLEILSKPIRKNDLDRKLQEEIGNGGSNIDDTGWQDLSLRSGVTAWGDDDPCQYRRWGKFVQIRGAVKSPAIGSNVTVPIADLPAELAPSCRMQDDTPCLISGTNTQVILLYIDKDSNVLQLRNCSGSAISSGKYTSIICTYMID